MNIRKSFFFSLFSLRGQPMGKYYHQFLEEERNGIPANTTKQLLTDLLAHCKKHVSYYAEVMASIGGDYVRDPQVYLKSFPILDKNIIRARLDELKSDDLCERTWFDNTSGGSTGEPSRFIQDWEYASKAGAVKLLFSKLAGREIGEPGIQLWGSVRDIEKGSDTWKVRLVRTISNERMLNAYQMTAERMREYVKILNKTRPKQIVAYANAIYELARFAEKENLYVAPQASIITSADTLFPFMREKIEEVFQCKVYNRYGSREVGDIACEKPEHDGLWVAPWGNYIEIVDRHGNPVPDGTEGEIIVTSLTNYAMPLVRYRIGDMGALAPMEGHGAYYRGQVLKSIFGRNGDMFKLKNGGLIRGGYFTVLLYHKDWIEKYQVIQKSLSSITFRIVKADSASDCTQQELAEITAKTRIGMGQDCEVNFEFVEKIPPSASGKYRYVICEVPTDERGQEKPSPENRDR